MARKSAKEDPCSFTGVILGCILPSRMSLYGTYPTPFSPHSCLRVVVLLDKYTWLTKGISPNFVGWKKAMQRFGSNVAPILPPEFEEEAMDRLAGLRGMLITYRLQYVRASHNVPVLGLSPVLQTEAMGIGPMRLRAEPKWSCDPGPKLPCKESTFLPFSQLYCASVTPPTPLMIHSGSL